MKLANRQRTNVLFVCSMNQWRSPTAEKIYQNNAALSIRSRGTSRRARRPIRKQDIDWAELIVCMEHKHKTRVLSEFPGLTRHKVVEVLDIPDDYRFMDPELVEILEQSMAPVVEALCE